MHILLYSDDSIYQIPPEITACFEGEPKRTYENFLNFTEGEQKAYVDWVYATKTEATQVERTLKMMQRVSQKLRLQD